MKMPIAALLTIVCMLMRTHAGPNTITVNLSINEEMPADTVVGILSTHKTFQQLAASRQQRLSFSFPKTNAYFSIDETSGALKTRIKLNREALCGEIDTCCQPVRAGQPDCYIPLQVLVSPLKEFAQVTITIIDTNDNAPLFSQSPLTTFVPENEPPGRFCIDIPSASDPDSPPLSVKDYRLEPPSSTFKLRINTRPAIRYSDICLLVMDSLDREKVRSYSLRIVAVDGGTLPKTGTLSLTVRVLDTNDNR
jgi:hypothetical protein